MRAMQANGALDADLGTYVDIVRVSSLPPVSLPTLCACMLHQAKSALEISRRDRLALMLSH